MPYIRKSHVAPRTERVRFDELLAQARAGVSEARRELLDVYHIRVYVQGDRLVDDMNHKPARQG